MQPDFICHQSVMNIIKRLLMVAYYKGILGILYDLCVRVSICKFTLVTKYKYLIFFQLLFNREEVPL